VSGPGLWALTCLFNPQGYRNRIANYRAFRRHLEVPLIAVELSFNGRFELADDDADILVRIDGGDVLWQKERLLNLGVARLPRECRAVSVLDCDIVFENRDWPLDALSSLERSPVVQLFSETHFLPRGADPGVPLEGAELRGSFARAIRASVPVRDCLGVPEGNNGRARHSPGLAWAFRRELLDRHGLFDGCVIGGGDTAMACASWGAFDAVEERHAMNARQRSYYRAWAEPWYESVRGNVDFIDGKLFHLWHGEIADRRAAARHLQLVEHDFDPHRDLARDGDGPWRWASPKPAMHRMLADYFAARREDG
jgi:hypothetical protein